jgi:hypothetical protein
VSFAISDQFRGEKKVSFDYFEVNLPTVVYLFIRICHSEQKKRKIYPVSKTQNV